MYGKGDQRDLFDGLKINNKFAKKYDSNLNPENYTKDNLIMVIKAMDGSDGDEPKIDGNFFRWFICHRFKQLFNLRNDDHEKIETVANIYLLALVAEELRRFGLISIDEKTDINFLYLPREGAVSVLARDTTHELTKSGQMVFEELLSKTAPDYENIYKFEIDPETAPADPFWPDKKADLNDAINIIKTLYKPGEKFRLLEDFKESDDNLSITLSKWLFAMIEFFTPLYGLDGHHVVSQIVYLLNGASEETIPDEFKLKKLIRRSSHALGELA